MHPDRDMLLKWVGGLFGMLGAIGGALFTVDGALLGGLLGVGRVGLLALGGVGVAATLAYRARLPFSRPALIALLATGELCVVGYLVAFMTFMVRATEEEFRRGKLPTILVGVALSAVAVGGLAWLLRALINERDR